MFGKEKIRALEDQLNALKGKMNTAEKEKKELEDRLNGTKNQLQAAKAKRPGGNSAACRLPPPGGQNNWL